LWMVTARPGEVAIHDDDLAGFVAVWATRGTRAAASEVAKLCWLTISETCGATLPDAALVWAAAAGRHQLRDLIDQAG
jgi:hypothetical protein